MTGFGVADGPVAGGTLKIEIRSVNHRHFNPQIKTAAELTLLEADIKNALRTRIERGHVSCSARWAEEPPSVVGLEVDVERARQVLDAVRQLQESVDVPGDVDLSFLIRQNDVLRQGRADQAVVSFDEVLPVLENALAALLAMREREGAALAAELNSLLDGITGHLDGVKSLAPERLVSERDRLRASVKELLDGGEVDEARLAQELAFLADKLDITEETVRLETHVSACRETLSSSGSIGRKLSFLGQEMLREVNTIGSKANDAGIAALVIEMKGELEKFREQVENVE